MLETINLEVFGAFSGMLAILVWLVKYFKDAYKAERKAYQEVIEERYEQAQKELEVLKAMQELLKKTDEKS